MDNNKRNLKITITVVCVVLALAIIGGGIYIGNKLGLITIDHGSVVGDTAEAPVGEVLL